NASWKCLESNHLLSSTLAVFMLILGPTLSTEFCGCFFQLDKDYQAWASGDSSRKPLGTGEI
uniref:Uncharacterized protein n=1 Tax=Aegilops tauschii subsp. strangulata TaxID=200361 RepID=A0A453IZM1_AEGTS